MTVESAGAARREWRSAGVVLVGEDLVPQLAGVVGRRDHVVIVARDPERIWREAVHLGAAAVVRPGDDEAALAAIGDSLDGRSEGCTVSVVGGSGGVGASTFAAALGLTGARRGLRSVLLDADPAGVGVEVVLGSERAEGLRWPDLATSDGRLSGESLADVLPRHQGLATVSWPATSPLVQVPAAADAVWAAATRAFDLVVADAPRGPAVDAWTSSLLAGSVLTVVVVADDLAGVGAARRLTQRLQVVSGSVAAVAVTRRGGLGRLAVEETIGVPVVAQVRPDRRLRRAVDHGRGPGGSRSLRRAAVDVLDLLGLRGGRP